MAETQFAPAARLSDQAILRQAEQIRNQNLIPDLSKIIPYILLVLNRERQIIYSGNALLEMLGLQSQEELLGLRPGEALDCVHSCTQPGGCGTTEYCSVCGAVLAILESQETGVTVSKECLFSAKDGSGVKAYEFLVRAIPAPTANEEYTLFIVKDISEEKRRQAIEQIFFHDLLNTSGSAKGFVEIMKQTMNPNEARELCEYAGEAMDLLIDEIKSQKDLIAAENGELNLSLSSFSAKELVVKLVELYLKSDTSHCPIHIYYEEDVMLTSDIVLVRRVVDNMLKNAVEASEEDAVTIGFEKKGEFIEFRVHNRQSIDRNVQLQIFKRSYSSKGSGRGLGTYSMKLLGEKYLRGYIHFTSETDVGTTFVFGVPLNHGSIK